jgi:hypothetical protein
VRVAAQAFCLLLGWPSKPLFLIVFVSLLATLPLEASGPPNAAKKYLLKRSELQSEGSR